MTKSPSSADEKLGFFRSLRGILLGLFLSISTVPLLVTAGLFYFKSSQIMTEELNHKLTAIRDIKANRITAYFHERIADIRVLSRNPATIEAMRAFDKAQEDMGTQSGISEDRAMHELRPLYLHKPNLADAKDGSGYSAVHAKYHPAFSHYQREYGYYDIFLVEPHSGNILYSVFKESDYGTSLLSGAYADSNIAHAFRVAVAEGTADYTVLEDFAHYAPSDEPAAFIASPVVDNAELLGILIFQLSIKQVNAIMQERTGLGKSGETYLVGPDKTMRSDSLFSKESTILTQRIDTRQVEQALDGNTGTEMTLDYRGASVLSAYRPLAIAGLHWVIVVEQGEAEIFTPVNNLNLITIGIVGVSILVVSVLALFFSNSLTRPLEKITGIARNLAGGNLKQHIEIDSKSEIGLMAAAFREMIVNLQKVIGEITQVLGKLAEGDFKVQMTAEFAGDFIEVKDALLNTSTRLAATTEENNTQTWLKSGHATLNEKLRGEQAIAELSKNTIDFLVTYLKVNIGLIYILKQSEAEQSYLQIEAVYGYTLNHQSEKQKYYIGEDLVGQAVLERNSIVRSHTPEEYSHIVQSGLVHAVPKHVLLLPFLYENEVKGVVELGASSAFSKVQQEFLEQAMPSIGIAVNAAESRTKMRELLEQSQAQAEQLKIQQAEMQQANEELQNQTEELQTQQEEMESQQEELRQTNELLEQRGRDMERQQKAVEEKNAELEKARGAMQEKAEELALASKYKSEFLANMSHELRTPLNSLLILAQMLTANKEGNLTEKQVECANTIYSSGSDLLALINEILDLSKVEAGKVEIHVEKFSFSSLITSLRQKFQPLAEKKKLSFDINLAAGLPADIHTDSQRLKQIVNNLLSNAFKFTEQGVITVDIRRPSAEEDLSRSGLKRETSIAFSVVDSGIGIPQDKQKVIFEAFQQADGTTSRRYGGTGLGLSISRQLAHLLGGEIQLQSAEAQGSRFTVYLPEKTEKGGYSAPEPEIVAVSALEPAEEPAERGRDLQTPEPVETQTDIDDDRMALAPGDKSLLIVEDDRTFSHMLMDLAREKNFKCLLAENGREAIKLAEEYHPSAIVLDVGLPQVDGWTVMEKLKDNPDTRHLPVHFVSGGDHQRDARKMGAIGYSLKPVSITELGEAFKKIEHFISDAVKNLLVVTDNEARRDKILEVVGNEQINISSAASRTDAWQQLLRMAYEWIILDTALEGDTGLEFLKQLRADEKFVQIPVIIYTERDLTSEEQDFLAQTEMLTVKAVRSPERLLDETTLFLHEVESRLPETQQKMLRMVHDKEAILKDKKVLVFDDDPRNTFALAAILESKGMEVVMAGDGEEGLELLDENPDTAIILMDIMMPKMDGYEAMQRIRAQARYRRLPIIALTAKAMKGDRGKCIEAGASDYLAKPVDMDKLLSLMRVWLYR